MRRRAFPVNPRALVWPLLALIPGPLSAEEAVGYGPATATYQLKHGLTVKNIPVDAKRVRVWFWFPDDDEFQRVRNAAVTAPDGYQVTRDKDSGHRYLYVAVDRPGRTIASLATEFLLQRREASVKLDPDKAGPITAGHRVLFAEHLLKDCPHMEVTEEAPGSPGRSAGTRPTSPARRQAVRLGGGQHRSLLQAGGPEVLRPGSAAYCLASKGGGCTDQHALFVALARARGIPTRLHFGSVLREENEDKDHNPGYRCWVQYFVPNYGWTSADLSEADTRGRGDYYFSNLDERHIRFAEGRNLRLTPAQDGPAVNLFLIAHVEVDGRPHAAFDRVLRFKQVR